MRAVVTRVRSASVTVEGRVVGRIGGGLLVLLGVGQGDGEAERKKLLDKLPVLRIFEDEAGKMNRSLVDIGGRMLVISQFTLFADVSQGRRPYFGNAAAPGPAEKLYEEFKRCAARLVPVECGVFAADMQVSLCNDGPVTILLEAERNAAGKLFLH